MILHEHVGWRTRAACGGRCTARTTLRARDASAQIGTLGTQSGVYFGRFFCMNGRLARSDPDDRQRPVGQAGQHAGMHGIEVFHEVPLGRVRPVEELLIQMGEGNI